MTLRFYLANLFMLPKIIHVLPNVFIRCNFCKCILILLYLNNAAPIMNFSCFFPVIILYVSLFFCTLMTADIQPENVFFAAWPKEEKQKIPGQASDNR